jgi:hypothetical protein
MHGNNETPNEIKLDHEIPKGTCYSKLIYSFRHGYLHSPFIPIPNANNEFIQNLGINVQEKFQLQVVIVNS